MNELLKYFPNLTQLQIEQFKALGDLYPEWNAKINVISRKDIDNLYINHILHSLSIAKFTDFKDNTSIIDIGTGGGFPGIPLAIMFPQATFLLVDRTGKKIKVAEDIAQRIELQNVALRQCDVSEVKDHFDFAVSRAVMSLKDLLPLAHKVIRRESSNSIPNGLICLKGGSLESETAGICKPYIQNLCDYFSEPFFETKKLIYIPL